ncbi:MAG TPA: L,D-transpeptidase, partial [Xanthobacteraceae bacterium]|nr:L,D-transpeptidase [Xanthobacteraceae bacterium]
MRHRDLILAAGLAATALGACPAQAAVLITVDKGTQEMSVAVDGAVRFTWRVSTGRRGHDTPNGTFRALSMDANHFSKEWDNAPMPHSIF